MTITVTDNPDGSFTIGWDENDPVERVFNDWTEDDFVRCFTDRARSVINELGPDSSEEWTEEDMREEEEEGM
jgi:hypothetical protein